MAAATHAPFSTPTAAAASETGAYAAPERHAGPQPIEGSLCVPAQTLGVGLLVLSAEPYSTPPVDYYPGEVLGDCMSFLYAIFFYQVCV